MNVLIIGHKGHGKDEVGMRMAGLLSTQYRSSSLYLSERVILPVLGPLHGYGTAQECYEDRNAHRKVWFDLIHEYNTPDLTRLAREILSEATIYVGMRNRKEFEACQNSGLFDAVVWVDASQREPLESPESMELTQADADCVIDNNGRLGELHPRILKCVDYLERYHRPLGTRPTEIV